mmetsp:Transcript_38133/g.99824  ORF Transcript_38133/g.99824 Transcript_38133/m.99824 type:complete len:209 (-) Transcript_38133:1446-2072(-)
MLPASATNSTQESGNIPKKRAAAASPSALPERSNRLSDLDASKGATNSSTAPDNPHDRSCTDVIAAPARCVTAARNLTPESSTAMFDQSTSAGAPEAISRSLNGGAEPKLTYSAAAAASTTSMSTFSGVLGAKSKPARSPCSRSSAIAIFNLSAVNPSVLPGAAATRANASKASCRFLKSAKSCSNFWRLAASALRFSDFDSKFERED